MPPARLMARTPHAPRAARPGQAAGPHRVQGLRVLDKQRQMHALVAERPTHGSMLPLNREDFRRTRKPTNRGTRMTEQKQRMDRERRTKQKHAEQLTDICAHGRELVAANRAAQDRITRLGKDVLSFHAHTEKEEQKRIERISKEPLKALKADDEGACVLHISLQVVVAHSRCAQSFGKTIQTISLITYLIEVKKQRGPYLVIMPLSTMTNWGKFAKWAPSVKMISYTGNLSQRKVLQNEIRTGNFQVLLTTYKYVIKDRVHPACPCWACALRR